MTLVNRLTLQCLSATFLALTILASVAWTQDFKKEVIYQIVTDRFFNGDTSNDNPPQSPGLFDQEHKHWRFYWGGDLAGIQQKLAYLKGMGITAVWISPPLNNINVVDPDDGSGQPTAPYHGYWARDMKQIEEHFGDVSNSWTAFDNLVAAAHTLGIKIVVDFAPNHTSSLKSGEYGALYDNGRFLGNYAKDAGGYFHHNGDIQDGADRYQIQYYTLAGLADLNQENPIIDAYLKDAVRLLAQHGADGFRIDAVKHVTWGWEYSLTNTIFNNAPSFVFGEWFQGSVNDPLYHDSYKFANRSGMALLDFPLNQAIQNVFALDKPFSEIDRTLSTEDSNFTWHNDLVTFIDNHDLPRLLSVNNSKNRLNEAIAFLLVCRGIPVIYYGDEQYIHDDTRGGGDPYNRNQMSAFSTDTPAYSLINMLSGLRRSNDALAYGTVRQRWMNDDIYIVERQFFSDVAITAINKNETTAFEIKGLNTALPPGDYRDFLSGLLGGLPISVSAGSNGNNAVTAFTLPAHTVSVWQFTGQAASPEVGSIGPTVGQPGLKATLAGRSFGRVPGNIFLGKTPAAVVTWSDTDVTFVVPSVANGVYSVQLTNADGAVANLIQFTVLTAKLIPVTFTVNNTVSTQAGDYIFLTGNTVELGNWGTTFDTAIGPMLHPNAHSWFINAAMPAGTRIQFKFIKIDSNGGVTFETGANHVYQIPSEGVGHVNVNWL